MPCWRRSSASRSTAAMWRSMTSAAAARTSGHGGVLHVDPEAAGQAGAQVRVEPLLDLGHELLGRADHEVVERRPLEAGEERVERVVQVVELLLLHRPLVARLGPAALVVLAVHVVLDVVELLEPRRRAEEDPRRPAVDEQHAPARGGVRPHQRLDARVVVDDRARLDRVRQPDDLEHAGGTAGEHRQAVRSVGRDVRPAQHVAHALDVRAEREARLVVESVGLLDLARRGGHDRVQLGGARGRRGELARVEVEEDGEDHGALRAQLGEPAEAPGRDGVCHNARATLPPQGPNRRM